ncbi:hypothetical protein C8R47DRAFT_1165160 [Mycena vitilis]|nr:hypothetical protein C8R47DRAFT_1165160 [Mycena vitilis]
MAISTATIIDLATPNLKRNLPGIPDEVRARLEWNWGLGYHRLDEHLQGFTDPEGIFTDETLLVFPPNDMITLIWHKYGVAEMGVRRPYIQTLYKGCMSFEYMVVPIDPTNPRPARLIDSDVPPHLALCTTSGKMMQAWGALPAKHADALCLSVAERLKAASHGTLYVLTTWDFSVMEITQRTWSSADCVPSSFHTESSDQMVEWKQEIPVHKPQMLNKRKLEANSSASNREPKRRLLPCERRKDPCIVSLSQADGDDDDSALGTDSHISGVDDPDEFAKASAARGDYKLDRKRRKEIKLWAKRTSGAELDAVLLNDAQVEQYSLEQPRLATSLDLAKPNYVSRCKGRKA